MTEVGSDVVNVSQRSDDTKRHHLWKPGQSGNPKGRPRGSRAKLAEDFVGDCYQSWQQHGAAVLERMVQEQPAVYLKVIAGILPKDVNINVQSLDDLSDDQLMRKLQVLTEMAKPLLAKLNSIETTAVDVTPQDVESK